MELIKSKENEQKIFEMLQSIVSDDDVSFLVNIGGEQVVNNIEFVLRTIFDRKDIPDMNVMSNNITSRRILLYNLFDTMCYGIISNFASKITKNLSKNDTFGYHTPFSIFYSITSPFGNINICDITHYTSKIINSTNTHEIVYTLLYTIAYHTNNTEVNKLFNNENFNSYIKLINGIGKLSVLFTDAMEPYVKTSNIVNTEFPMLPVTGFNN